MTSGKRVYPALRLASRRRGFAGPARGLAVSSGSSALLCARCRHRGEHGHARWRPRLSGPGPSSDGAGALDLVLARYFPAVACALLCDARISSAGGSGNGHGEDLRGSPVAALHQWRPFGRGRATPRGSARSLGRDVVADARGKPRCDRSRKPIRRGWDPLLPGPGRGQKARGLRRELARRVFRGSDRCRGRDTGAGMGKPANVSVGLSAPSGGPGEAMIHPRGAARTRPAAGPEES